MTTLKVNPDDLRTAGEGINGVISDLNGGPVGAYTSGLGRGFSNLELNGLKVGHPAPTSALESFTKRWEWGTRALIQQANKIAVWLDMTGVGFYNKDREYVNNAGKDMVNDLIGDPSLQKDQVDKLSWGQLAQYNANRLANPDWSPQSFAAVKDQVQQNLSRTGGNLVTAAVNATNPAASITEKITGVNQGEQVAASLGLATSATPAPAPVGAGQVQRPQDPVPAPSPA